MKIEVPYQQLATDTLDSLIESFLLREGTDYGEREFTLEEKRLQVKNQIVAGKVLIVFDQQTESCTLISAE